MSSGKSSLRKKNSRGGSDGGGTIAKVLINSIASMGVKEEDDQTDAKPVNSMSRPEIILSIKDQFSATGQRTSRILQNPQNVKEFCAELQKPHVNVNEYNHQGDTPLHSLVKKVFKKKDSQLKFDLLLALLISSDVNVNCRNQFGRGDTALHMAVEVVSSASPSAGPMLVDHTIRRSFTMQKGWLGGDLKIIKLLLAFGANINALNSQNKTPLDLIMGPYRFFERQESIVRESEISVMQDSNADTYLTPAYSMEELNRSVRPSYKRRSSLIVPNFNNNQDVAKFLRDHGATRGRDITKPHSPVANKSPVQMFMDVASREKDLKIQAVTPLPTEKISMRMLGDNWTMRIPAQYYELSKAIESRMRDVNFSLRQNPDDAVVLATQMKELRLLREAGSRILFLDGGGMRGLIHIEILSQLEEQTGRRITELFDWVVATSTGGLIALGLVHAKKTLKELRQIYYKFKEDVVTEKPLGVAYDTEAWENILRSEFGDIRMDEVQHPRVLITVVDKSTVNLKLLFFNNCFDDDLCSEEVWKVARYTTAAPLFFNEMDNKVDGGVLANNPASSGLTKIQDFYRDRKQKLPISLVVSIGTGKLPEDCLGRADAHEFLSFGKHWFNFKDKLKDRVGNLTTLLNQALTESEVVASNVRSRCLEQGISYYRFSPQLREVIPMGETDNEKLIDMVLLSKSTVTNQPTFSQLVLRFHMCSQANKKMTKRCMSKPVH